jgi:hypothetical protein
MATSSWSRQMPLVKKWVGQVVEFDGGDSRRHMLAMAAAPAGPHFSPLIRQMPRTSWPPSTTQPRPSNSWPRTT